MPVVSADLVFRIRQDLQLAGFHLVAESEERSPGLHVYPVPEGARVVWSASHAFAALTAEQSRARRPRPFREGDSMQAVVQSAVAGLLFHLGYTLTQSAGADGITVLAHPDTAVR